ncbi:MAG: hypothetical protein PHS09_04690 [Candidatus Omnitrophica bacterium]|nr:hypothetical protein [Candidatus Omnitrophota bacterium]MDD5513171.1 hypothetical protein [Candidatus Omnitrophota bacterium]
MVIKTVFGKERSLAFFVLSLIILSGCASQWDRQRKQLNRAYQRGQISDDNYSFMMHKVEREEKVFLQQAQESKILKEQAIQREKEGYYIPPPQTGTFSNKNKNCSAQCDCYGNCETVCE